MDFYLQTRDRPLLRDYRFLGRAPARAWWRERYHDLTAFEYPTVLLESDADGWRMLVSAIPSERRDVSKAVIRWTVVMEGTREVPASPDRLLALGLLRAWIEDLGAPEADPVCSRTFDALLPAQDVADWYEDQDEAVAARVEARVREVCERLSEATAPGGDGAEVEVDAEAGAGAVETRRPAGGLPRSWIGAVGDPLARAGFLQRAEELVGGAHGRALLVNLLAGPGGMEGAGDDDVVVLIQDDEKLPDGRIHPLPDRSKAPPADRNAAKGSRKNSGARSSSAEQRQESPEQARGAFPAKGAVDGGIALRVGTMRVVLPRPEWRSEDGRTFHVTGEGTASSTKQPEKRVTARGEFTVEGRRIEKGSGLLHTILTALGLRDEIADGPGEVYECSRVAAIGLRFGGNSISVVPYAEQRRVDDGLEISVDLAKYTGERVERRAVLSFGLITLDEPFRSLTRRND